MTRAVYKLCAVAAALTLGFAHTPAVMGQLFSGSPVVRIGGAEMRPDRNVMENLINSDDHTVFIEGLRATGLFETLLGPGQFTVFAPHDVAFRRIPPPLLDALFTPDEIAAFRRVLSSHILLGRYSSEEIVALVEANGGSIGLSTLSGDTLGFQVVGGVLLAIDERARAARTTILDAPQSNGMVHVINAVLFPQ